MGDSGWAATGLPCPCGRSSDAFALNDDGFGTCFSGGCERRYTPSELEAEHYEAASTPRRRKRLDLLHTDEIQRKAIPARGLTLETVELWDYGYSQAAFYHADTDSWVPEPVQVANYRLNKGGPPVAQKLRTKQKNFQVRGDLDDATGFYGEWLWREGGKRVVIVEGEIDAMTVSQLQEHKWPVVSPVGGAGSLRKCVAKSLKWLDSFETIVLMMDSDAAGQEGIEKAIPLLPPRKVRVATLPLKDPSAMHMAGRGREVIQALWDAAPYHPVNVSSASDLRAEALRPPVDGLSWPWPELTTLTHGIIPGAAYWIGAGVGIGKTELAKEIQAHLIKEHGAKVGIIQLEEHPATSLKHIAGKLSGHIFHDPEVPYDPDDLTAALDTIEGNDCVHIYRHDITGADWESIYPAMLYMVESLGVSHIFLDNLTVMVADLSASDANTKIGAVAKDVADFLAKHPAVTLFGFSHLNPPKRGPAHEMGGSVYPYQFTGSRALMRFGQALLGIERNNDPRLSEEERSKALIVLLKDRQFGKAGKVGIEYVREINAMVERQSTSLPKSPKDDEDDDHGSRRYEDHEW